MRLGLADLIWLKSSERARLFLLLTNGWLARHRFLQEVTMQIVIWGGVVVLGLFLFLRVCGWLLGYFMLGQPTLGWWSILNHLMLRLRGLVPQTWEYVVENGYMYIRVNYSNGSTVDFREFPRFIAALKIAKRD